MKPDTRIIASIQRIVLLSFLTIASPGLMAQDSILSEKTHAHVLEFLETFLSPGQRIGIAERYLASQNADGTWNDIDYHSSLRGNWPTARHLERYSALACAYYHTSDAKYLKAARKALGFWYETMPVCKNWWYNEISAPRTVGPATILIMKDLPEEEIEGAVKILAKASLKQTGQNKIWQAEGVMMRAYLQKDEALLIEARDTIASEIRVDAWKEGIQPDWSFHQHGPQLQWGNYGGAYAGVMSWLVSLFDGTPLAFSPEQRKIIADYIICGVTQPIWKGWYDMNACGRQITPGTQLTKARGVLSSAARMGIKPEKYIGGRYFPYSDFGIYKTEDWYASVRMESSRTIGAEHTNSENMHAKFAADGALLVRRDGDEYNDVSAAWDWHHVPGVTCHDDGKGILGWDLAIRNKSGKVTGKAEGDYMVCAMELERDGLKAHKAWFFCPDGIICLGCGISFDGNEQVVTGVEQCIVKEEPVQRKRYIFHNGITYIPMDGVFSVAPRRHTGKWGDIHPAQGDKVSTMDLLDIYIDHGKNVENAHYAYVVCPSGQSPEEAARIVKKKIKVESNTSQRQAVMINGKTLGIDWNKAEISF